MLSTDYSRRLSTDLAPRHVGGVKFQSRSTLLDPILNLTLNLTLNLILNLTLNLILNPILNPTLNLNPTLSKDLSFSATELQNKHDICQIPLKSARD